MATQPNLTPSRLRAIIADPVRFSGAMLGARLWAAQAAIMQSVATNTRTSVRACTASGKTFAAARLALWWLARWPDGVVIVTATTWKQVEMQVFDEIRKAVNAARDRIAFPDPQRARLQVAPGRFAIGLSPKEEETIGGWHEGHVLIIVDEASGVREAVHAGIEGPLSGGNARLLELGNPLSVSGPFYEHHHGRRSTYATIRIGAFDTPNFAFLADAASDDERIDRLRSATDEELDAAVVEPKLITPRWVRDRIDAWGTDSPPWESRIMGEFPRESEHALFPLVAIERAGEPADDPGGSVFAGVDVAGPGRNETVVIVRAGDAVLETHAWTGTDARGRVVAALAPWRARLARVNVDEPGIGYYLAQHLKDEGLPARGINTGTPSADPDRFANLRAQVLWNLRDRLVEGRLTGLTDPETQAQMAPVAWEPNSRGRVAIEKKTGARAWDRVDALALAFYEPLEVPIYTGPFYSEAVGRDRDRHRPARGAGSLRGREW